MSLTSLAGWVYRTWTETQSLHLLEGGVNGWTHPVHHVFEDVHEVCNRVGVGLQLDVLDEPIDCRLSIEFCEGDGVLWACGGC